ncbi:MAG: ABC transporter ATP-binding protein [Phycisphaerales bacterium]|nr:ABC transporter ATP-binding protein [Phycisphaerales bacterium]
MISIQGVTKRFGRSTVLTDVSLDVLGGGSVAFWGANGAGKSTLLRCVLGLLRFDGRITVGGHDVLRAGKHARMLIGYVPQELGFYDDLRVDEAVRYFARLKGIAPRSVDAVLVGVGLPGQGRKRIRELSGGMKQRLALAVAMLGDPPVLVLDEVTASLDACGRGEFVSLLSRLSGTGRTLLFASHRVEEIAALAERVVVLERGKIETVTRASDFSGHLGADSTLHLTIRADARDSAAAVLRSGGFAPRHNGVGLLVPVRSEHKAAPFRLLADASIAIDDFELLTARSTPGHAHTEVHS